MIKTRTIASLLLTTTAVALPSVAHAGSTGPIIIDEGVTLDPMFDARLRYERVDQDNIGLDADALTIRLRPGIKLAFEDGLSFLVEADATLSLINDFNSTTNGNGGLFSVVADPENIELTQLVVDYKTKESQITLGRQRINLDDQRFVGSVGWRQNDQTFDAVRVQTTVAGVSLDATYAISQRTIFGIDAGRRQALDGNHLFLGAGYKIGPVKFKGFGYFLEYDADELISGLSSQTVGIRAAGTFPVGKDVKLNFTASYAVQSDYRNNPNDYKADYIAASLGGNLKDFGLAAGYEKLGSDSGVAAFRTPLATLHKFNGWADIFLATPANGLNDYYATASVKLPGVKLLPGLNAAVTYHKFEADTGGANYGREWDAKIGFKLSKVGVLIKYAIYKAKSLGTDTEKLWVQLGYKF